MTIEGTLVRYEGKLWQPIEVDGTSVHLLMGVDGICVDCQDAELRAAIQAIIDLGK